MARSAARDAPPPEPVVALLRGINVGGRNKVTMAELRAGLSARGLTGVRTFIASGNVVVDAPGVADPVGYVQEVVARTIAEDFGFACSVLVRTAPEIRRIAEAIPPEWDDPAQRGNVLYLFPAVDRPEVLEDLVVVPGVDVGLYVPGAVLWCTPRTLLTRSGLVRFVGMPLYPQVTIRNTRTAKSLAALVTPTSPAAG